MKRTAGMIAVMGALAAAGAVEVAAQDATRERSRRSGAGGIEAIMQMRDRLELTEEQIASLDELRRESVERRSAERAAMSEMRSQLAAGQIRRSELMAFMEERRDARVGVADQERARLGTVLDSAQLATVEELRTRSGRAARYRDGARRAPRAGVARGYRGGRGPGMTRGERSFRREDALRRHGPRDSNRGWRPRGWR